MKNIKLFEEFSDYLTDPKLKWPDAPFWIEELYPEELCYLALYSERLKNEKKEYFIPVYCSTKDGYHDLEEYTSDDPIEAEFQVFLNIPSKKDKATFSYDVEARGYYRRDSNWPEEVETTLNNIEFSDDYYLNSDESLEVNFSGNYEYKSDIISEDLLTDIMQYVAECKIHKDVSETNNRLGEIPKELIEKCEEIRKNHTNAIRGTGILKRFGGF